jgi:hypothetical protein
MSPQDMIGSYNRNRFGDSVRANYQRLNSMTPEAQQAFRSQLASTPQGQAMLADIDKFQQSKIGTGARSVPGRAGFVQRLDPVTGRPVSQISGIGQNLSRQVRGMPGSFGKAAPQFSQNLGTVGRGASSAARGFGQAAMRGLASGPKVGLGAGVGLGGLLTGGAGAYLGAKAYQYFRDRAVHNQNINKNYLERPDMAQRALMGLAQLNQLESLKGATNSIDDAIDRLKAYAVAAVGKVEQGPAGQQLLSGFNPAGQQGGQQI